MSCGTDGDSLRKGSWTSPGQAELLSRSTSYAGQVNPPEKTLGRSSKTSLAVTKLLRNSRTPRLSYPQPSLALHHCSASSDFHLTATSLTYICIDTRTHSFYNYELKLYLQDHLSLPFKPSFTYHDPGSKLIHKYPSYSIHLTASNFLIPSNTAPNMPRATSRTGKADADSAKNEDDFFITSDTPRRTRQVHA